MRGVAAVEARLDLFDEWDSPVLHHALFTAVSASVLVFRYERIEQLAGLIARSKAVTDCFPGLTAERGRVFYVDTGAEGGFEGRRDAVYKLAVERRLLGPEDEDMLFERVEEVGEAVVTRVGSKRSIVHVRYVGAARRLLEEVFAVVNREVGVGEAQAESAEVGAFLGRLRGGIHTKVCVRGGDGVVVVARGDDTGYSIGGGKEYMRMEEYNDFRDIGTRVPFCVEAKVRLGEEGGAVLGEKGFWKRGKAVGRIRELVEEGGLLLAVADERKTMLERRKERFVARVDVIVYGGGFREYLHARMIRACVGAVREDTKTGGQMAVRVLLGLVPELLHIVTL